MEWRQWCYGTFQRLEVLYISPGWNYFANGNFMLLWFSNSLWLMRSVWAVASISLLLLHFLPTPIHLDDNELTISPPFSSFSLTHTHTQLTVSNPFLSRQHGWDPGRRCTYVRYLGKMLTVEKNRALWSTSVLPTFSNVEMKLYTLNIKWRSWTECCWEQFWSKPHLLSRVLPCKLPI